MPSFPERLLPENDKVFKNSILLSLETAIAPVSVDYRDQWPKDPSRYIKGGPIVRGDFGAVKAAECRDPIFGFVGNEARRCIVKTIYFRRRIEFLLADKGRQKDDSVVSTNEKLARFWRRTMMDIYVLTRCRHENLLHAHCLFVYDDDLHIITPRLYVLRELIELYRTRHNADPCPAAIIIRILRQVCVALDYLNRVGIVHRDVQPDNIFLTRNGTVKLGHFGQSRSIVESPTCITPVGKFEFMAFEKQHNFSVQKKSDCLNYSASADVWSLGILVLQMVTYYPNEPYQKLPKNFAALMYEEKMPFTWLLATMMQLRSRLVKSGGDELKTFLSNMLLTFEDSKRPTPAKILRCSDLKRWCSPTIEEDKKYLRKKFIDDLDFANQYKLEADGPNYDALESKNIPAEFYWDDSWKILEDQNFSLTVKSEEDILTANFRWGDPAPLFRILTKGINAGFLELSDFLVIEPEIDKLAFDIVREISLGGGKTNSHIRKETKIDLEPSFGKRNPREIRIVMEVAGKKRLNSLGRTMLKIVAVVSLIFGVAHGSLFCPHTTEPSAKESFRSMIIESKHKEGQETMYRIVDSDNADKSYEVVSEKFKLLTRMDNSECPGRSCVTELSAATPRHQGSVLYLTNIVGKLIPPGFTPVEVKNRLYCTIMEGDCGATIPIFRYYKFTAAGLFHAYSTSDSEIEGFTKESMPLCWAWSVFEENPKAAGVKGVNEDDPNLTSEEEEEENPKMISLDCNKKSKKPMRSSMKSLNVWKNHRQGAFVDHYYTTKHPGKGYEYDDTIGLVVVDEEKSKCNCLIRLTQMVDNKTEGIWARMDHKLVSDFMEPPPNAGEEYTSMQEEVYCVKVEGACGATVPLRKFFKLGDMDTIYTVNDDKTPMFSIPSPPGVLCYIWSTGTKDLPKEADRKDKSDKKEVADKKETVTKPPKKDEDKSVEESGKKEEEKTVKEEVKTVKESERKEDKLAKEGKDKKNAKKDSKKGKNAAKEPAKKEEKEMKEEKKPEKKIDEKKTETKKSDKKEKSTTAAPTSAATSTTVEVTQTTTVKEEQPSTTTVEATSVSASTTAEAVTEKATTTSESPSSSVEPTLKAEKVETATETSTTVVSEVKVETTTENSTTVASEVKVEEKVETTTEASTTLTSEVKVEVTTVNSSTAQPEKPVNEPKTSESPVDSKDGEKEQVTTTKTPESSTPSASTELPKETSSSLPESTTVVEETTASKQ